MKTGKSAQDLFIKSLQNQIQLCTQIEGYTRMLPKMGIFSEKNWKKVTAID